MNVRTASATSRVTSCAPWYLNNSVPTAPADDCAPAAPAETHASSSASAVEIGAISSASPAAIRSETPSRDPAERGLAGACGVEDGMGRGWIG